MLSVVRRSFDVLGTLLRQKSILRKTTTFIDESDATESSLGSSYRSEERAGLQVSEEEHDEVSGACKAAFEKVEKAQSQGLVLPRKIPKFHRRELQLSSKLLGKGAFSEVFEVKGITVLKNGANLTSDEDKARNAFAGAVGAQEDQDAPVLFNIEDKPPLKVAAKHLSRKLLRRPEHFYQAALDLSREANCMSQLDHPHILKLRAAALGGPAAFSESGRYDGFFIVTDLLSDTLEQRMQEWKRCWVYQAMEDLPKMIMKTQYATQLASALGYLHDRRIIFRDCKPDNIGFKHDSPHTLQLFDFGISRTLPPSKKSIKCHPGIEDGKVPMADEEETFLMSMAGTTRYMASEVMATGRYNLKADVHSFAMVIYEMYAEKKPFPTLGHDGFYELICRCKIRPPVTHLNLPEALKKLIMGSWCPYLEHRLSMKDVNEVLPTILREMEEKMMPTSFAEC